MRALITGANRGIGLEIVRQLAARGDHVFAACRRPGEADALRNLQATYGDLVTIVALDVTDPASIAAAAADVRAQADALDLLINNAASAQDDVGFGAFDPSVMQALFLVNTIGPLLTAEHFIDLMRAGEGPKIINISSGAGSLARRTSLAPYTYGATKAALNFFSRNLSHQLRDDGIIVISLSPGWVRTDMGGADAKIEVDESVSGMLSVIDGLTPADSGEFYSYTGARVDG